MFANIAYFIIGCFCCNPWHKILKALLFSCFLILLYFLSNFLGGLMMTFHLTYCERVCPLLLLLKFLNFIHSHHKHFELHKNLVSRNIYEQLDFFLLHSFYHISSFSDTFCWLDVCHTSKWVSKRNDLSYSLVANKSYVRFDLESHTYIPCYIHIISQVYEHLIYYYLQ